MRTNYVTFLFLLMISTLSYGQNTYSKIDSVFRECNESKIKIEKEYLIQEYGDVVLDKTEKATILQLFELFLINNKLLKSKSKESYISLLEKIQNKEFESGLQEKFYAELDFGTYRYFNPSKFCYGELRELGLIGENSWQTKINQQLDKFEATGGFGLNSDYLIVAIRYTPKEDFKRIYNRRIFLNWIFLGLSTND